MAKKFTKGWTYIVKKEQFFYLVQQTGMKSWTAMRFSHVSISPSEFTVYSGNGEKLFEILNPVQVGSYRTNEEMRRAMFSVLEKGYM